MDVEPGNRDFMKTETGDTILFSHVSSENWREFLENIKVNSYSNIRLGFRIEY